MTAPGLVLMSSLTRYGGGERWMLDAGAGLAARGWRVTQIARPGSEVLRRAQTLGIDAHAVEMRGDLDVFAASRVATIIRRHRPDAMCVNLDREIRIAVLARAMVSASVRPRLFPRRGSEFPLKDKWHYRLVYKRFVERVIVNSRATQKTMLAPVDWLTDADTQLIYNGIPIPPLPTNEDRARQREVLRAEQDLPHDAVIVLLVGELNERKGQHLLLQAVARLPRQVFALFVGDGDARDALRQQASELGVTERVRWLGFRDDVSDLLLAADVLTLPSRIEGFGYVLVEAMAAGVPVVATAASSIPEIVVEDETGYLVPYANVDALTSRLSSLVSDPELRIRMGAAGYDRAAERFNIERMLDELEALLRVGHV